MRRLFVFLGVVLMTIGSAVRAQGTEFIPDISLDMRGGYKQDFAERAGRFYGDGLYLNIDGKISQHFSYSLNQRLASSYYEDNSGFNGTNWLTLTYEVSDFAFTFGKDALLMGSFEYDAYDLDTYYDMNSMFYNTFDCWQWGVSAAWYPAEDHELIFQFANSPFAYGEPNRFAFALGWRGAWSWYESYWTANLWQYDKGRFMKAVNLGNRFHAGSFSVDLDIMGRFGEMDDPFCGWTASLSPSYGISDWGRAFVKAGIEGNAYFFGGAGFEYFPLKENKEIRIHAAWSCSDWGVNILDIGLTWKFDITGTAKHIFGKLNK